MKHLGIWKPMKKALKSRGMWRDPIVQGMIPCLEAITVDEVIEAAAGQLRLRGARTPVGRAGRTPTRRTAADDVAALGSADPNGEDAAQVGIGHDGRPLHQV